jgi:ribosomal protein S18 acetylase RimI-like enzyme
MDTQGPSVREYRPEDEVAWVRCRTLAFLGTSYFDDVFTTKPQYETPSIDLVATRSMGAMGVVGLLDVAVNGELATIETIAVHPDEAGGGIGTALLEAALRLLPHDVATVDAWTREDAAANAWYLGRGFEETYRYLHVFATGTCEMEASIRQPAPGLTPAAAFFHADIGTEATMRQQFRRVHVCRRYELSMGR